MKLNFAYSFNALLSLLLGVSSLGTLLAQEKPPTPVVAKNDKLANLQERAIAEKEASWGHWGNRPGSYSAWTSHSNRLIPIYVFGGSFAPYMNEGSIYRDAERLERLYGRMPSNTVRKDAVYADQTDVYALQRKAIEELGKKYVFLVVFDGMDWQSTFAAAVYKSQKVGYHAGRGTGLLFQDYDKCPTDFGYFVTSPYADEVDTDVDAQINKRPANKFGGFDPRLAGSTPWQNEIDIDYPIGRSKISPHAVTDSSSSATSMTTGVKAYNGAVNLDYKLEQAETIAQWAQRTKGFSVGAVTSVPISHATPASAYSANVSRDDYQDLTRDMLGLPSVSRKSKPLPGLDVVIGGGFGEETKDPAGQGQNFVPGNRYLAEEDLRSVDVRSSGPYAKYVVAQRTAGQSGAQVLSAAAAQAIQDKKRLLGFFGAKHGHLPFRTANGDFKPVADTREKSEAYTQADIDENPSIAQIAKAAIEVLQTNEKGFWLMVEAGDVDWANHSNNIDSSIGAVLSGEEAIREIFSWIESRNAWDQSLVIVTADHGHYFHLTQPEALIDE